MHEMSIAESVLQIIEDTAQAEGCARVKAVWLEIGQLAGVEKESLRFCFDVVTRDSVAQDAKLEMHRDRRAGLVHGVRPKCRGDGPL